MKLAIVGVVLLWIFFVIVYSFIFGVIWNAILPQLFGFPSIDFIQSFLILTMAYMLVKPPELSFSKD